MCDFFRRAPRLLRGEFSADDALSESDLEEFESMPCGRNRCRPGDDSSGETTISDVPVVVP